MLKVLHIGKYYPPFHGGIENFLCDLAECQLEQGDVEPTVLVHQHEVGRAEETETANGVFVRRVRIIGRAVFTPLSPLFLLSLNRTIEERNPDILHLHLPNPSTFWCLVSKSARKRPWIIHWHSDVLTDLATSRVRVLYPAYRILERALLKCSTMIVCTSPPYLDSSIPLQQFKNKCGVIPLGVRDIPLHAELSQMSTVANIETNTLMQEDSKKTNYGLKLIMIGRLTYYKGHQVLIDALMQVKDVTLDIIGTGELERTIRHQIDTSNLSQRIRLLGDVSQQDLHSLIRDAHVLCLPSIERAEAFGLVILEAARQGRPSIVTNVFGSGMGWVVSHGSTGRVIPANDVNAMIKVINEVKNDRQWLVTAGRAARTKFEESFTIQRSAELIKSAYQKCTSRFGEK